MRVETDNNAFIDYEGWRVVKRLGAGSFGAVYEIEKEDFGQKYKSALKVISIPQSEQDLSKIKKNIGKSDDSLEFYYKSVVSEVVKEFELMYKLKGTTNIVSYEDHQVRKHENGVGWDILIRMELLTPLETYMQSHPMKREDVIQLGIDICKALERCAKFSIIHRDIKPGNIFVSEQGDFKLGDFGIARTIEAHDTVLELSQKGTITYMAPEVYKGTNYDFSVDLYSLGIVMYRMLNKDTLPFVPLPPQKSTYQDMELAKKKRMEGVPLPDPCEDHTQLAKVVLKACSYLPEDRYASAGIMREHLEKVQRGEKIESHEFESFLEDAKKNDEKTECLFDGERTLLEKDIVSMPRYKEQTRKEEEKKFPSQDSPPANSRSPKKMPRRLVITVGVILIIIIGVMWFSTRQENTSSKSKTQESVQPEEVQTEPDLQSLIEKHDFVSAYRIIQDSVKNGENMDKEIQAFVYACKEELEYKRATAAMKLLSGDVAANEQFYKETVQWFCSRDQQELTRQIISDLRGKGEEGAKLADAISLESNVLNAIEEGE